jgi:hypothetical protein
MIQFRFNPRKASQAIQWMLATATDAVDFHTILKTIYFADKRMLNEHGRPIFGANYRAMNYGPVPLEVYEMLKCEPYWLTELAQDDYPWLREGYRVRLIPNHNQLPEPDDIAPAEMDTIREAFEQCREMTFNQRTRETHGMDWVEGTRRPGERMAYEDMIAPDRPDRNDLIEDLEAMGPRLVL